ncbi:MAG: hypothetical protein ACYDHY_01060 [Acidiferrobacterales bacterium]
MKPNKRIERPFFGVESYRCAVRILDLRAPDRFMENNRVRLVEVLGR